MHNADRLPEPPRHLLTTLTTDSTERLAHNLEAVGAELSACYERALGRLRQEQWVPLDAVKALVDELSAAEAAARGRAAMLTAELDAARAEIETARAQSQAALAAQAAAGREHQQAKARFTAELTSAREALKAAAAVEAALRSELSAVRNRCQQIVESHMLQLVEFNRELERGAPHTTRREEAPRPVPAAATPPRSAAPSERAGRAEILRFEAIEAALAGSPPLGVRRPAGR
jgi:hypothetical protein